MTYTPASNMDVFNSAGFRTSYVFNGRLTPTQHQTIAHVAAAEPAPQAAKAAAVTENCQHWCIRVLQKLVGHGIVTQQTINGLPAASLTG